jgi:hypothetical protein
VSSVELAQATIGEAAFGNDWRVTAMRTQCMSIFSALHLRRAVS